MKAAKRDFYYQFRLGEPDDYPEIDFSGNEWLKPEIGRIMYVHITARCNMTEPPINVGNTFYLPLLKDFMKPCQVRIWRLDDVSDKEMSFKFRDEPDAADFGLDYIAYAKPTGRISLAREIKISDIFG